MGKQTFAEKFERMTDTQKHEAFLANSLLYFCDQLPVVIDGKKWDLNKHRYQVDILADNHIDQTWRKSAQMGASLMAIVKSLHAAYYHLPHGVLYMIPTRTDVIDFSKKKFSKVVEENPIFQGWIRDTDSAGMKKVGNSFIIFRGMQSSVGLKVQDVDMLVYDELEEATSSSVALAEKRVSHSEFKWKLRLSVPSDNDSGIDEHFQKSDQNYWLIKCRACNYDVCMEDEFPNCLLDMNDYVLRVCPKCGKEIHPINGKWVPKFPSNKAKRGYQISQLWSYYVTPAEILEEYRNTKNMAGFYNNTLGLPYTDVSMRLTVEQALALTSDELMLERDDGPCMMGVDPGNLFHVVVGKKISDRQAKIIRVGIVKDTQNSKGENVTAWDIIGKIIKRYNVSCCVIDGRPSIDDARKLANKLPGRVYLYFHSENQRGVALWRDGDWTVNINACEAMDASHAFLKDKRTILPRRSSVIETFAKHCHAVGRKLQEDEETGDRRYYWKKLGEDHFRRAFNLMVLAMERTGMPARRKPGYYNTISNSTHAQMEGYGG